MYSAVADVDGSKELMAFYIGTISPDVWGNLQEIGINYWGDSRSSHAAAHDEGYDVAVGSRYVSGVNVVNWPIGRIQLFLCVWRQLLQRYKRDIL